MTDTEPDLYGRSWPGVPESERCRRCGQPDNCGDCNHVPLTGDEVAALGGTTELKCDNCGRAVRVADGLHFGGYRHDDDTPNAGAEWCETDSGYVRVTVHGQHRAAS